ncbi:MAG: hypothetical protein R2758_13060 [Bacteroidales bacterium]
MKKLIPVMATVAAVVLAGLTGCATEPTDLQKQYHSQACFGHCFR